MAGAAWRASEAVRPASFVTGAFLVEASLRGADLRGADLRGAYLRLAELDAADLSDANLYDVEGLIQAQLDLAHCNSGTELPEGFGGVEDAKR